MIQTVHDTSIQALYRKTFSRHNYLTTHKRLQMLSAYLPTIFHWGYYEADSGPMDYPISRDPGKGGGYVARR